MKIYRAPIYCFLTFIMLTSGCYCGDEEDDDGLYTIACKNIDVVQKTFTFEIYARYYHNNEPIQGEGSVTLTIDHYNYSFVSEEESGVCKYDMQQTKPSFTTNFDQNGKAVITTPTYDFDNKHDHMIFTVTVHFPFSSDQDQFANTQYGSARYNSEESTLMFFKYLSIEDL